MHCISLLQSFVAYGRRRSSPCAGAVSLRSARRFAAALLLVCLLPFAAAPARGEAVTFAFTGLVQRVFDGLGVLDESVRTDGLFRGSYTFDSDTPNSAPPTDEGEAGLYRHESPPAGVRTRIGNFTFRTVGAAPQFEILVNNNFGFTGADEYGFSSYNNEALGLAADAPIDQLAIDWFAWTLDGDPFDSVALPTTPPDLAVLGGGSFTVLGECSRCDGPAAFFRIEGTLTSLVTSPPGDMDCDGDVDHDDTDDFVLGLVDAARYESRAGFPPSLNGDINQDGVFDFDDIPPFVDLLNRVDELGTAFQSVPEPATHLLAAVAALVLASFKQRRSRRVKAGRRSGRSSSAAGSAATLRRRTSDRPVRAGPRRPGTGSWRRPNRSVAAG